MRGGNSGEFLLSRDHAGEGAIKSRIGPGASPVVGVVTIGPRAQQGRLPSTPLVTREVVHQKLGRSGNTFRYA